MRSPRVRTVAVLLLAAATAVAAPPVEVVEVEPNSLPEPADVGVLGPDGLRILGTLDPTSPTGGDPGDRDAFAFSPSAAGPLTATVDDGGAGTTFVLGLVEVRPTGTVYRGGVIGPAPLRMVRPGLKAGSQWKIAVAALGDGNPLPYTLDLETAGALPPWTGEICASFLPEQEPNAAPDGATDLGDATGVLCGRGTLSSVEPEGSGTPADNDHFRLRAILPVPMRLVVHADPGTLEVSFQQLSFVGAPTVASTVFGEEAELAVPPLEPGAVYFIRFRAFYGEPPIDYEFHLEPVAGGGGEEVVPMEIRSGVLRFDPAGTKSRYSLRARFEPGTGGGLGAGLPFSYALRDLEEEFPGLDLKADARGRLVYRGPPGVAGLRRLVLDPFLGTLRIKGRGRDPGGDPSDPTVDLEVSLGGIVLRAESEGTFAGRGRKLKVR